MCFSRTINRSIRNCPQQYERCWLSEGYKHYWFWIGSNHSSSTRNLPVGGFSRNNPEAFNQTEGTRAAKIPTTCPLSFLRQGQSGRVILIDTENAARLEQRQIFGLIPGAKVVLEQRSPELVLRVDHTSLTIERMTVGKS
jgi:Fe2+ transport system protein FeoA